MTETVSGQPTIDNLSGSEAARDESPAQSVLPTKSLRGRLRDETRMAHERLDASFAALASGEREDYATFLRVNASCLGAIEPLLEKSPLGDAVPGLRGAGRHAAAMADLDAMGWEPIASLAFPLSRPTLAEAVGIAYVVEGSRLGARMILKQLRNGGSGEPDRSFTTFFLESAGGPERFRDFLGWIETLVATAPDRDAAVAAADATFAYFLDAVRRVRAADHDGGVN